MLKKEEKVKKINEMSQEQKRVKDFKDALYPPEFVKAEEIYNENIRKILTDFKDSTPKFLECQTIFKKHGWAKAFTPIIYLKSAVQMLENQLKENE